MAHSFYYWLALHIYYTFYSTFPHIILAIKQIQLISYWLYDMYMSKLYSKL